MKKEVLNKTFECLDFYSDMDYIDHFSTTEPAKYYSHKTEDYFNKIIIDDYAVFQAETGSDLIGIELETFEDLKVRFKSFTGQDLKNIEC